MLLRTLLLLLHALAGTLSLLTAFWFRFELNRLPEPYADMLPLALPLAFLCKGLAASLLGLHRYDPRFASFADLKRLTAATTAASLLFALTIYSIEPRFPRGPLLLDFLLTLAAFAALRFAGRFLTTLRQDLQSRTANTPPPLPLLILGNGPLAEATLRFLAQTPAHALHILGFVAESPRAKGSLIHGLPILGTLPDLPDLLQSRHAPEIIIALDTPSKQRIRDLYVLASAHGAKVRIVSRDLLTAPADPGFNPIRKLHLADFLGRPPVELDPAPVHNALSGKRILITGAGGSIGSELARQLAGMPIHSLVLLDLSENALFEIAEELQSRDTAPPFDIELCDIRDPDAIDRVLRTHQPDILYHAAACKHVSLMERHPFEAVKTNVLGTQILLEAAQTHRVSRFLHVSTDKAVDAVGIMGASKAMGEQLVLAAARTGTLTASCVRFGNVLGSNGSVIPLFEKQLQRGGPLRVTHAEATRYFMTLEEAVTLILQAEALQQSGRIFVLDMGEPVNILAMARQIRDLHQAETGTRPDLEITGLRPGEKIHEVLLSAHQSLTPTRIPKVNTLEGDILWPDSDRAARLHALTRAVTTLDEPALKTALFRQPA